MYRKILLVCGILAALIYVGTDIVAAMRWEGYSYTAQSVSELRAIHAPTRSFLLPYLFAYAILEIAYALGIWASAAHKRWLRVAAVLLFTLGLVDLLAYFFPLNTVEEVESTTNTLHLLLTGVTVLLILLVIVFGAQADGRWFRVYSFLTVLIVIVMGALAFLDVPRIAAQLPTPWLGVRERINIYGYMLWMGVLAVTLLRAPAAAPSANPPAPIGPPRLTPR